MSLLSADSRHLSSMDDVSVKNLHNVCQNLVFERLVKQAYPRITIDFDGSVIGTGRYAEGTAIGFNKKKKGQRSDYPLFCMVAQTGQVLAILLRSGNVHDSNGAEALILKCLEDLRTVLPHTLIELRMDGAFLAIASLIHWNRPRWNTRSVFRLSVLPNSKPLSSNVTTGKIRRINAITLKCNGSLKRGRHPDGSCLYVSRRKSNTKSQFSWICSRLMNMAIPSKLLLPTKH